MATNPFTNVSSVAPSLAPARFLASLMRTCSSPPLSGSGFFPEGLADALGAVGTGRSCRVLPLVAGNAGFLGGMNFKEMTRSPL